MFGAILSSEITNKKPSTKCENKKHKQEKCGTKYTMQRALFYIAGELKHGRRLPCSCSAGNKLTALHMSASDWESSVLFYKYICKLGYKYILVIR